MTTQPQPPGASSRAGYVVIAGIVVAVAVLLFLRGNGSAPASAALAVTAEPDNSKGFRADAWSLPDDSLLGFVEVPGGSFIMGSDRSIDPLAFDNERWSSAEPRGTVDLPGFYIGRYEVTVEQFRRFAAATGRKTEPAAMNAPANHPVTFVSWPDSLAYCRWLEAAMKASPATPALLKERLTAGWRMALPSEAQWEKAARGLDGRRFPWGQDPRRDRANFSGQAAAAVGSLECPECPYGLSDMSGNVWEWTRSPYQPYPYDPADDLSTIGSDALWVMRGGSFNDNEQLVRTTARTGADPGVRRPFIGFRVVISGN